jgi:hypothetical protein
VNVGGKSREVLWWAGEEVSYLGTTDLSRFAFTIRAIQKESI